MQQEQANVMGLYQILLISNYLYVTEVFNFSSFHSTHENTHRPPRKKKKLFVDKPTHLITETFPFLVW
jgi:hypothetical protein